MNAKLLIRRHPLAAYFVLTFTISWLGAFLVAARYVISGRAIPDSTGMLMFPAMLLGPSLTGFGLTAILRGKSGLRELVRRMTTWHVDGRWYAVTIMMPPLLILFTLLTLCTLVSSVYSPNHFGIGIGFGLFAGYLEEIGWMGFAFPRLCARYTPLTAGIALGLFWGLWHAPVVDFLGAAYPHGAYQLAYFLAFVAVVAAIRVLIAWVYTNTQSILLAQTLHASSTGFLVVFSPGGVSAGQEVFWYAVYAVVLWGAVAVVARSQVKQLGRLSREVGLTNPAMA